MKNPPAASVPTAFARRIHAAFGADGDAWLARLPSLLVELAARWELSLGAPFELSYNYVVAATRPDGTAAVLKIGVPVAENRREIAALRVYDGNGACRVIESDVARGAMLLERVTPGDMLVRLVRTNDEHATRIGARLMRTLWRPVPAGSGSGSGSASDSGDTFKPLAEWFARAFAVHRAAYAGPGPLPARVFEAGVALAAALLDSAPARVLLHADFHHYNVLSAMRAEWLAIDPKGMTGDPGYEVGPFICNPRRRDGPLSPPVLQRRLDILAEELEYDRARLRDWSIAHAVLSACWSAENHGRGWRAAVNTAEMLLMLP